MKMKLKIEISDDMEAKIIVQSLYESIDMMFDDSAHLSGRDKNGNPDLEEYEATDLKEHLETIEGLKSTYKYYTLRSEWSNLDRFSLDVFEECEVVVDEESVSVLDIIEEL